MTLKARSDSTGGGLAEARFPAGLGPPLHVHHREGEALRPGRSAALPPRRPGVHRRCRRARLGPREIPHTFQARQGRARALVLVTPAGLEATFEDGGGPARDISTPPAPDYDVEKAIALAAKYGFEAVGPPLC